MKPYKIAFSAITLAAFVAVTACEAKPKEAPDWQDAALMEARASVSSAAAARPTETSRGTPIIYDEDLPSGVSWTSTPSSDCFSRIGYDADEKTLGVTFRSSEATYYYYGVPASVWRELSSASSKGGYYNEYIKGQYTCEKEG